MTIAIEGSTLLGDVVTLHPGAARVLEALGLDYCCGGRRPLADACVEHGLDLDDVLRRVDAAASVEASARWTSLGMVGLVDHIVGTHHSYLWSELRRLSALTEKIADVHGARHPELADVATTYAAIRADLEIHLLKEERILFPMVRQLGAAGNVPSFRCGSLRNPLSVMLREHDTVGELLRRLRDLTGGYAAPGDGCATYQACFRGLAELEADTHEHIHKENNVLFPMVEAREQAHIAKTV
jgi:regulator of cell morphogenesis and NO signaling